MWQRTGIDRLYPEHQDTSLALTKSMFNLREACLKRGVHRMEEPTLCEAPTCQWAAVPGINVGEKQELDV